MKPGATAFALRVECQRCGAAPTFKCVAVAGPYRGVGAKPHAARKNKAAGLPARVHAAPREARSRAPMLTRQAIPSGPRSPS